MRFLFGESSQRYWVSILALALLIDGSFARAGDAIGNLIEGLDAATAAGAISPPNGKKGPVDPSQCDGKNNYLEKDLQSYTTDQSKNHNLIYTRSTGDISINIECVKSGLRRKLPGDRFKHCEDGKTYTGPSEVPSVPAPCLSETYVNFTHRSLTAAMNCMREVMVPDSLGKINNDWRQKLENQQFNLALAMMRKESGYHVNAISFSGAAGGGQLTDNTILDMNAETFNEKLRKELARLRLPAQRGRLDEIRNQEHGRSTRSNAKICEAVINLALAADQPIQPGGKGFCSRIEIANTNPFTNFVYSIAYMKRSREIVEKNLERRGVTMSSVLTNFPLEREKLLTEFAVWGYNAGPGTIVNAFERVLKDPSVNKNDHYVLKMKMKEAVSNEIARQKQAKSPNGINQLTQMNDIQRSQREHSEYLQAVLSEYEDMKSKTGECVTQDKP